LSGECGGRESGEEERVGMGEWDGAATEKWDAGLVLGGGAGVGEEEASSRPPQHSPPLPAWNTILTHP
jgi:hypothetical protein